MLFYRYCCIRTRRRFIIRRQRRLHGTKTSVTVGSNSNNNNNSNSNKIVDLRSDTVTMPSNGMLQAAISQSNKAKFGDDVYGEDIVTMELQNYLADLTGKEAGLFVPTGTMANLASIISHCNYSRSCEILVGKQSHINLWEAGNTSNLGGISMKQLNEDSTTGQFSIDDIYKNYQTDDDDHCAETALLCLENTHNMMGGIALSENYMNEMGKLCSNNQLNIKCHVDGARIFNSVVALQTPIKELCSNNIDSISICFSKGLGTPMGSCIVGNTEFIRIAKRVRKRLGGGMRQTGVMAAMAMYSLRNNIQRLEEDHYRAQNIGSALIDAGFYVPRNGQIDTNIVYFGLPPPSTTTTTTTGTTETRREEEYVNTLYNEYGIKVSSGYSGGGFNDYYDGGGGKGNLFRLVTHLDIDDDDTDRAIHALISCV